MRVSVKTHGNYIPVMKDLSIKIGKLISDIGINKSKLWVKKKMNLEHKISSLEKNNRYVISNSELMKLYNHFSRMKFEFKKCETSDFDMISKGKTEFTKQMIHISRFISNYDISIMSISKYLRYKNKDEFEHSDSYFYQIFNSGKLSEKDKKMVVDMISELIEEIIKLLTYSIKINIEKLNGFLETSGENYEKYLKESVESFYKEFSIAVKEEVHKKTSPTKSENAIESLKFSSKPFFGEMYNSDGKHTKEFTEHVKKHPKKSDYEFPSWKNKKSNENIDLESKDNIDVDFSLD